MKTKLIIFDCDGVIVDSENIFKSSQREAMELQNIHVTETWLTQNTHGFQLEDTLDSVERLSGKKMDRAKFIRDYEEMLTHRFTNTLIPVEGVLDTCKTLHGMQKQICLATNGEAPVTDLKLRSTGMDYYFTSEVRFFAAQVKNPKPAPDLFKYAAEIMKHNPEDCVVIEDSPFGIRGAKAAGMRAIGFLGGSHTPLAGKDDYSRKLFDAGADIVIDGYSNLMKAIL
jgi:HAD superfamily hydrolase (TIGR01509 family)